MTRLMIVDDHPLFLDGLKHFLTTQGDASVTTARTVAQALEMLEQEIPDALILDLTMRDGGGLRILSELRARGEMVPIIFLTVDIRPEHTLEAIRLGVNGIVLKEGEPGELLKAIERVRAGQASIDPAIMQQALMFSVQNERRQRAEDVLSEREKQIAALIRDGLRNKTIAERCGLTEGTVKVYLHSIFQKLGVSSRAELIVSTSVRDQV